MTAAALHIVHLDTGRDMRGGQWQALALMRGLAARGIGQTLLTPAASPLAARARQEKLAWHELSFARLRGLTGSIVHAHDARAHTLAWLYGARPLVVARRVAFPIQRGWFSRRKYAAASLYLAVSRYVQRQLESAGVPAHRIRVVYDGVEPLPQAQAFRIVALEFDDKRKRTDLIREAAALAHVDIHFTRDLVPALTDARAFVYITDEEGLGSAILLAQSAGVPVVASNVGGIPEIVEQGETGFLVDNTTASIAAALLAIKDIGRSQHMAEAARRQAHDHFSVDLMVDRTLAAYRSLTGFSANAATEAHP